MNWVFRLEIEFEVMGAGRMWLDSKYVYSGVIKDDLSSGGDDDSKEEESIFRAEKNETLDLYI